jgi:hypothetical protein
MVRFTGISGDYTCCLHPQDRHYFLRLQLTLLDGFCMLASILDTEDGDNIFLRHVCRFIPELRPL